MCFIKLHISPDGGEDDRYYDENGNFLYDDHKGDQIRIVPNEYLSGFNSLINNGVNEKVLKGLFDTASNYELSGLAWQNISTDIYSLYKNPDNLLNGKTSISYYEYDGDWETYIFIKEKSLNDGVNLPINYHSAGTQVNGKVKINLVFHGGKNRDYDDYNNLTNVMIHEDVHGANNHKGHKGAQERKAYKAQIEHESWKGTTETFRLHMLTNYKSYGGNN